MYADVLSHSAGASELVSQLGQTHRSAQRVMATLHPV